MSHKLHPDTFIKFVHKENEKYVSNNRFEYKIGENKDINPFDPSGSCKKGGLYYTDMKHGGEYAWIFGDHVAIIEIPPTAQTYTEPCKTKYKADTIIVKEIMPFSDFANSIPDEYLLDWIREYPPTLKNIDQSFMTCFYAVWNDKRAVHSIFNDDKRKYLSYVSFLRHDIKWDNVFIFVYVCIIVNSGILLKRRFFPPKVFPGTPYQAKMRFRLFSWINPTNFFRK